MRTRFALLFVLALVCVSHGARADDKVATAQVLFEEGRALMARGEYAAACSKLEGSQSLDPGPGTEYNLALCYEKMGKTASAWASYLSAATAYKATKRPDWETRARERATTLEATLSKLTIVLPRDAPKDLRVSRNGVAVIASALGVAVPVDPGRHVISVSGANRQEWKTTIDLSPGAKATVEIPQSGKEESEPKITVVNADGTESSGSTQKTLAFVAGGVGIAALGLGLMTGLFAINENAASERDCPNDGICESAAALEANEAASKWATVSTISCIGAGVLLAASVALFLTAPSTSNPRAGSRSLRIGANGVGWSW